MDRKQSSTRRGYGRPYQRARAAILEGNPPCHWCGDPATTADHEPPLAETGTPHLNLVPACRKCNYGRGHRRIAATANAAEPSRSWFG